MFISSVFTIVQNEPIFFPIWLNYYLKSFQAKDIHVIHHVLPESSWDEQLYELQKTHQFQIHPVVNEKSFDHEWLKNIVCNFQKNLLKSYDVVLFAEVDEIIAIDPRSHYTSLEMYIEEKLKNKDFATCSGYEVVQKIDEEPKLDLNISILNQRKWWYWNKMYSKPLLSKIPLDWCWGFHACNQQPIPYRFRDEDLLLIHLHKMDFSICLERNLSNEKRKWADDSFGFQNRIITEERLKKWWYNHIDMKNLDTELVEIPNEVKTII